LKELIIISDVAKRKKIKINCRCGNPFVEDVPGELEVTTMTVVIRCPNCRQYYGRTGTAVDRLDEHMNPVQRSVQTKGRDTKPKKRPEDEFTWEMPESNSIN